MAAPNAPSLLSATATSDIDIDLGWTDNASDETGFILERSLTGVGAWVEIADLGANVVLYSPDTGLTPNTTYYYRVKAYNGDGDSAYSNTANATTEAAPQLVYDIGAQVYFDWDRDGSYTSEDDYLVSARGAHRLTPPGQSITATSGRVAECTIVLDNSTGRFSSHNTGGALYSYIGSGKAYHVPVRVSISAVGAGEAASYQSVFAGVARIPAEATLSPGQPKTITFDCRGVEEVLLNRRQRTTRANFAAYHDDGATEAEFMAAVIADSGADVDTAIDDGLFNIPWPWIENESIVEELWKLAAACGGRFYGDAYGQLVYENATHWLKSPHTTSQQSYTRGAGFNNLMLTWNETELAEEVSVTWTERDSAEEAEIYDSGNLFVPVAETIEVWADFSSPVYGVSSLDYTAGTPGGMNLEPWVTVSAYYYAGSAKLTIQNSSTMSATVRVTISGYLASSGDSKTVTQESADSFWTAREGRSRKVSGNRYVQTSGQAEFLKTFMADRQEVPPLFAKMGGCPGEPLRVIGDRVTVTDSELSLSATDFFIVAVNWRYDRVGFVQDFELVRCSDMYAYAGGAVSGGYFVLGTGNNTLGSGSSKPGKLFY